MIVLLYIVSNFRVGNSSALDLRNFAGIKLYVAPLSSWNLTGVFSTLIVANNFLTYSRSLATWALTTWLSSTEWSVRQCSSSSLSLSDSTTFTLVLERHWVAKWFILPQAEHLLPNAGQLFLAALCFPPQNLHLSTSLGLESLAFRSSFSRLLFADLSWLLLADTLPRFVWSFNEFTASPSSKFWSVFSTTRLLYKCWGIFVNQDLGS